MRRRLPVAGRRGAGVVTSVQLVPFHSSLKAEAVEVIWMSLTPTARHQVALTQLDARDASGIGRGGRRRRGRRGGQGQGRAVPLVPEDGSRAPPMTERAEHLTQVGGDARDRGQVDVPVRTGGSGGRLAASTRCRSTSRRWDAEPEPPTARQNDGPTQDTETSVSSVARRRVGARHHASTPCRSTPRRACRRPVADVLLAHGDAERRAGARDVVQLIADAAARRRMGVGPLQRVDGRRAGGVRRTGRRCDSTVAGGEGDQGARVAMSSPIRGNVRSFLKGGFILQRVGVAATGFRRASRVSPRLSRRWRRTACNRRCEGERSDRLPGSRTVRRRARAACVSRRCR